MNWWLPSDHMFIAMLASGPRGAANMWVDGWHPKDEIEGREYSPDEVVRYVNDLIAMRILQKKDLASGGQNAYLTPIGEVIFRPTFPLTMNEEEPVFSA